MNNQRETINALIEAARREAPELTRGEHALPGRSGRFDVVLFENAVFKGPKNEKQIPYIEQECEILKHIEGRGLPAPRVLHAGRPAVFFGMTRLRGEALTREGFRNMTDAAREELARGLASFMAGFAASFTASEARAMIRVTGEYSLRAQSLDAAMGQAKLREELRDNLPAVEKAVAEYAALTAARAPVAIHDDLHMANVLTSGNSGKITGILDFGFVNLALPEEGLFSWGRAYPEFTQDMCRHYSQIAGVEASFRNYLLCNLAAKIKGIANARGTGDMKDIADSKRRIDEIIGLLG